MSYSRLLKRYKKLKAQMRALQKIVSLTPNIAEGKSIKELHELRDLMVTGFDVGNDLPILSFSPFEKFLINQAQKLYPALHKEGIPEETTAEAKEHEYQQYAQISEENKARIARELGPPLEKIRATTPIKKIKIEGNFEKGFKIYSQSNSKNTVIDQNPISEKRIRKILKLIKFELKIFKKLKV
ncbi:MAG: hypothetical protein ACFFCI_00985 [Promethearchaeota archaeon]